MNELKEGLNTQLDSTGIVIKAGAVVFVKIVSNKINFKKNMEWNI